MESIINKGIAIVLVLIFAPVALLVLGQLGSGTSSFWYGINNPNITKYNVTAGAALHNDNVSGGVSILETVVVPIMVALGVTVVVLLGFLRYVKAM